MRDFFVRDLLENLFGLIAMALVIGVFILAVLAVFDSYKEVASEPRVVACAQKQMDSRRFSFTDSVVCVPYSTRRDTIAVVK